MLYHKNSSFIFIPAIALTNATQDVLFSPNIEGVWLLSLKHSVQCLNTEH